VTLGGSTQVETNNGFVYDPDTNTWGPQLNSAFPTGTIGDAQGIVLADKRFIVANINNSNMEAFDPATNSLIALNPTGKVDRNNEEGWNLLPDNTVLTVDAFVASTFEIFNATTTPPTWSTPTGTTPSCSSTAADDGAINITDFPSISPGKQLRGGRPARSRLQARHFGNETAERLTTGHRPLVATDYMISH
jgi:DNA-binding beta-propeller fold protein YncE